MFDTEAVKQAVAHFMQNATIPLLYKEANDVFSVATGTLFEIADRYFVITARHIFDEVEAARIAYPERMNGTAMLHLT